MLWSIDGHGCGKGDAKEDMYLYNATDRIRLFCATFDGWLINQRLV